MILAELLGVCLVGYGIWFASEGVKRYFGDAKDWWRPLKGKRRYPYPVSGILLGICFVVAGLGSALNSVWAHSRSLMYVAGAVFVLVIIVGVAQPRFFHPQWYGELEDRFGKKGVMRLKEMAQQVEEEDWTNTIVSEASFNEWVARAMPEHKPRQSRGYKKS